jgi:predicted nucleic acid-binding protein
VILADTTIWIDHFRKPNPEMQRLLDSGEIVMHPFVAAELALGSIRNRALALAELDALIEATTVRLYELRSLIEAHALFAKGIGLVDAHLIASCLITPGVKLWTRDKALGAAAAALGIRADLPG